MIDVPENSRAKLADVTTRLWITDSPLQADVLASHGETSVAVLGARAWHHIQTKGQKPLNDWNSIPVRGREVIIAFNSDSVAKFARKSDVECLFHFLKQRGSIVRAAIPKPSPCGKRTSIDMFFKAGETPDSILGSLTSDACWEELMIETWFRQFEHPYVMDSDGFFHRRLTEDGETFIRLTNWTAKVISCIVQGDGVETQKFFEIEANIFRRVERFRVTPQEFEQFGWVLEKLGPEAYIAPGWGIKDHVRAALQLLSGEVPIRHEFSHTGWVRQCGQWIFLHAGGSIGADYKVIQGRIAPNRPTPNPVDDSALTDAGTGGPESEIISCSVSAQLPHSLLRFSLPSVQHDRSECIRQIDAVIMLLKAAKPHITYPLVAAVFRASLGSTNFSIHLEGESGVYKTSLATVFQQFFGAGLDSEHLVGHWAGTANSLESLAFYLKDVLLLVDDFSPTGTNSDIHRIHRDAERLFRAKGNHGGRSRSTSSGGFRPPKTPRALLLSTGEDIPIGKSLRARILTITIRKGDIDGEFLAHWQQVASGGFFAAAMASYIRWLAPQYDQVVEELNRDRESWKDDPLPVSVIRRTYHSVRELEFGFCKFSEYARMIGAIDENQEKQLNEECWAALETIGFTQFQHITNDDPIEQFQSLLSALFSSGRVHVADPTDGGTPLVAPESWGYRKQKVSAKPSETVQTTDSSNDSGDHDDQSDDNEMRYTWLSCGAKIGWVDFPYVYFIPEVLFAELQGLANRNGSPLPFTTHTLEKRLADAEVFMRDEKRERIRIRITAEGVRQSVLKAYIRKIRWLSDFGMDKEERDDFEDMLHA